MTLIDSVLKNEKKVGIVAPSKFMDPKLANEIEKKLSEKGVGVVFGKNKDCQYGYLAGDDRMRAEALMEIWIDERVGMVWCFTGGYGATRLLPHLDFSLLRKHPKIFIGMSDITALHIALQKETKQITYLGPMAYTFLKGECTLEVPIFVEEPNGITMRPGEGRGELTGGNLALITSLMGTPWEIETEGKILLLEDVNEEPYRIDRMLSQLQNGGKLENVAGVILASFAKCEPEHPHISLTLNEVFNDYFCNASYPVLYGFPSGHIPNQVTLPLGAKCHLDAQKKRLNFAC